LHEVRVLERCQDAALLEEAPPCVGGAFLKDLDRRHVFQQAISASVNPRVAASPEQFTDLEAVAEDGAGAKVRVRVEECPAPRAVHGGQSGLNRGWLVRRVRHGPSVV
jgi:hypothetical protein